MTSRTVKLKELLREVSYAADLYGVVHQLL